MTLWRGGMFVTGDTLRLGSTLLDLVGGTARFVGQSGR